MTTAPLSLYFGVAEGERAGLETIARASLEWVEAIRDLASVIAPDLQFEIEFVESEEGSVWLSNLLKAVRDGDRKALGLVTLAVIVFFALGPVNHMQTDLGDAFWEKLGHHHKIEVSAKDKKEIIDGVTAALAKTQLEDRRKRMIREVERDKEIQSIGVGLSPNPDGPISKIGREHFPSFGADAPRENIVTQKNTENRRNVRVKIVRANLEEGDMRPRWRFAENDTKWSADIEDTEFVVALNLEETGLPLAVGQTMVVDVAIDTKLVDGAWEEYNRRIVNVSEPRVARRQGKLSLGGE